MNTQPDHPYLAEAVRRAASPQTEAECRERIAERAQAAFFTVVKMRSNTEQLLFEAKSVVHDLGQLDYISQASFDERLIAECRRLCKGDELKGSPSCVGGARMSNNSSSQSAGIGFPGLLTVLFIGLKLTGYIDWSWWWVLSPLWITFAIILFIVVICAVATESRG